MVRNQWFRARLTFDTVVAQSLDQLARSFANQTSQLLNRTVTDGVRLSASAESSGKVEVGNGISAKQIIASPIPIAHSKRRARVFLYLQYSFEWDLERRYLAMSQSTLSLYTSPQMVDDELIFAIDFARRPRNEFPGAHLHVGGSRTDLDDLYVSGERKTRKLRDLHFPVGGQRFRPTLEDMIEFIVTENMVEPREGWRDAVVENRARWAEIQVKTVVRANQDAAAEALRAQGWEVSAP